MAEGARELCGSDVVGVALRESGSDAMVFRYWSGVHGVNNASLRVGEGTGLGGPGAGDAAGGAHRRATSSDPRMGRDYAEVADRETIAALMAVPILLGSRVEGIIYVGNQTGAPSPRATRASVQVADRVVGTLSLWSAERPYSRADEEFVVSVAALLALRLSRSSGR